MANNTNKKYKYIMLSEDTDEEVATTDTLQEENTLEEEQLQKKEIVSACDISINQIFTALHFVAEEKANKINTDIKILNSAIDGDNEKSAKFYGAGLHIVAAIPIKTDGPGITKSTALPVIQEYIKYFSGPDIIIKEDQLNPLDLGEAEEQNEDKKTTEDTENKQKNENIYIPSFAKYLLLEDADEEKEESTETDTEQTEKNQENEDKTKITDEKANGWYITFNLNIKGQKTSTLTDALKNFGKLLIKGFGISTFDWRSGATGEVTTIGDMIDTFDKIFGKINPEELLQKYEANFKEKFPQNEALSLIWDTKTIRLYLKNNLDSKAKSKIKNAELSLCTRIDKRDKSYKLYNQLLIADIINKSISGIFKKFKNKIKKDDIILVNNYSDTKKDKDDKKYNIDKTEGAVVDSIQTKSNKTLLTESNQKVTETDVEKELKSLSQKELADIEHNVYVKGINDTINFLKNEGVNENDLFSKLEKSELKTCFIILTVESETANETISTETNLLTKLFEEETNTKVLNKVKSIFKSLIDEFKENAQSKNIKYDAIDNLSGYKSTTKETTEENSAKEEKEDNTTEQKDEESSNETNVNDSLIFNKTLNFMKMLYEDTDEILIDEILEATSEAKRDKNFEDKKNNKNQVIKRVNELNNINDIQKKYEQIKTYFNNNIPSNKNINGVDTFLLNIKNAPTIKDFIKTLEEQFNNTNRVVYSVFLDALENIKNEDNEINSDTEINSDEDNDLIENKMYYVIPDENKIISNNELNVKRTEYDFYIIPMKGLKNKSGSEKESK